MILVVYPICQVCEFKHLLNSDSHEKQKSSRKILKIHNQASRKFWSLLIFKLSSCDSSPSPITSSWRISESRSDDFYSSQFNSIRFYEFYEKEGRHEKKTILIFLVWPVVTLQLLVLLSSKIFKSQYFGFFSSDLKNEDSFENISIERIHGEKPILRF